MKKIISDYLNYEVDENGNVYNIINNTQLKGSIGENGYKYYRLSKNDFDSIKVVIENEVLCIKRNKANLKCDIILCHLK